MVSKQGVAKLIDPADLPQYLATMGILKERHEPPRQPATSG
jgi:hypothetical protein